jgi:hypothetical protein
VGRAVASFLVTDDNIPADRKERRADNHWLRLVNQD